MEVNIRFCFRCDTTAPRVAASSDVQLPTLHPKASTLHSQQTQRNSSGKGLRASTLVSVSESPSGDAFFSLLTVYRV